MEQINDLQSAATHASGSTVPGALPGASLAGADRRRHERRPYEVDVSFESDHNFYTAFTENISSGGLFVATRDIPAIGSRFPLTFTLPTLDRPITVECEVRWQRLEQLDSADSMPGVGVRFLDLGPEEREAVNAFIARRDTLFYDDE
ncbi:MAG: TIGR02266 family protein [Myxococcota bacterium]